MQDLCADIIGTYPPIPKIVNHDWLTPNPQTYDNYPSDNNPVRIGPKLADLWNHQQTGINLIPNQTVQQLGVMSSSKGASEETISNVVREAKKAMMMGLTGSDLADHIRARFASNDVLMSKEALVQLAGESGLLGNVYIDASAFTSSKEAEQFMSQHRTRLAQDIVINESKLTPDAVAVLASKFRKNVLAKVSYDQATFDKYRSHLVAAGRIASDFVIDSKETLRQAFAPQAVTEVVAEAQEKKPLDKAEAFKKMLEMKNLKDTSGKEASDDLMFREILPVLEFTRSQVVKGKDGSDLKEMLRKKYATEDIQASAKYMGLVVAELHEGTFTPESVDAMVASNELSEFAGVELKKLAKKYPFVKPAYEEEKKAPRSIGMMANLHVMSGNTVVLDNLDGYRKAAAEALRKGYDLDTVRAKLAGKLTAEEADSVILDAVNAFNTTGAGAKANPAEKKVKEKVVEDIPERATLPDPSTIQASSDEILDFFAGEREMIVDVGFDTKYANVDIGGLSDKSGMDEAI